MNRDSPSRTQISAGLKIKVGSTPSSATSSELALWIVGEPEESHRPRPRIGRRAWVEMISIEGRAGRVLLEELARENRRSSTFQSPRESFLVVLMTGQSRHSRRARPAVRASYA